MKYNNTNKPLECIMYNSACYKERSAENGYMKPLGILWHSTGVNNTTIRRYVQPNGSNPNYDYLMRVIGKNTNNNDLNHTDDEIGVNAWVGKLADGSISTVQTLPWTMKPWGCATGWRGSCNSAWIQFEICEDDSENPNYDYATKVYEEACQLTAYLCKMFNINPQGTVNYAGVTVPTILCHNDSYYYGLGSGHLDVHHWFRDNFGWTMQKARDRVSAILREGEDEDMTQEQFNKMFITAMETYRRTLQDNDSASWSQAAREWAVTNGIIKGANNTTPNYMWQDFMTREQMVVMLNRMFNEVIVPEIEKKG